MGQGRVVFIKTAPITSVIDLSDDGKEVSAIFDSKGFSIGEEEYSYGVAYDYKEVPVLLNWLKAQNLQWPSNIIFEG
jgi:hypothetical protein